MVEHESLAAPPGNATENINGVLSFRDRKLGDHEPQLGKAVDPANMQSLPGRDLKTGPADVDGEDRGRFIARGIAAEQGAEKTGNRAQQTTVAGMAMRIVTGVTGCIMAI
jgi:hypothetical protein